MTQFEIRQDPDGRRSILTAAGWVDLPEGAMINSLGDTITVAVPVRGDGEFFTVTEHEKPSTVTDLVEPSAEVAPWRLPDGTLPKLVRSILHRIERGPPIESHPKSCACGHEKCGRIDLDTMTYEETA